MKYGLTETAVEKICAVFARFPAIEKTVLYGSRAKGNFKTGSDIDLTLYGEALTSDLCSAIASALDDLLLAYTIDLSVFDELNHAKLREHIERVGVLFYERAQQGAAMKKGWKTEPLGELCEFQRGLTYAKGDEVDVSDNVVLRATNIDLTTNLLDLAELRYINDKVVVPDGKKVKKGSLIICTASGSKNHLGKVAYIDDDYGYAFGGFMGMITPRSGLLPKYLFHLMTSDTYKDFIGELSDGANINNLKFDDLRKFQVPHPPLPEQQRIVGILDEAFEDIATAKANAEKNLQNARALFSSGFGGLTSQSEQAGWARTTVTEIAASKKGSMRTGPFGSQLLHSEFVDEGIAVLGIDNAVANEFRWGKSRFITPEKYQQLERYRVHPGDVLISIMGTCGRCAIVPEDIPIAINTKHLCCITLDRSKCLPGYLHAYFLYHPLAQEFLAKHAKGAIMAGLNMGLIEELPVLLPPLKRQRELVTSLDSLREETQRLARLYERKLAALEALKKSLLHQAFTGQL